jgi:mono/diheme cytochrome c family protein
LRASTLLALLLLQLPPALGQTAPDAARGKAMFETHCGTCHSLALPKSQRLNRANWKWVIDDMVNQFGATWITDAQQALILDYLAENYGPDSAR